MNVEEQACGEPVRLAESRAAGYRFLSLCFRNEPSFPFVFALLDTDIRGVWQGALCSGTEVAEMEQALSDWRVSPMSRGKVREDYIALCECLSTFPVFRPNHAGCVPVKRQTDPENKLAKYPRSFANARVRVEKKAKEMPERVSLELDFMRHLVLQEVQARQTGDQMKTECFLWLQTRFLRDEMLPWLPGFCRQVESHAYTCYYRALAKLLSQFVAKDYHNLLVWFPGTEKRNLDS